MNYEPGTVAVATVRGVTNVRVFRSDHFLDSPWVTASGLGPWGDRHPDSCVTDVRPLIVLDLDGVDAAELAREIRDARDSWAGVADQIEAATKPPRIPEPGLWGVVEAHIVTIPRRRWVHHEEGRWVCDTGVWRYWDDLIDPVLVRPGIEGES